MAPAAAPVQARPPRHSAIGRPGARLASTVKISCTGTPSRADKARRYGAIFVHSSSTAPSLGSPRAQPFAGLDHVLLGELRVERRIVVEDAMGQLAARFGADDGRIGGGAHGGEIVAGEPPGMNRDHAHRPPLLRRSGLQLGKRQQA